MFSIFSQTPGFVGFYLLTCLHLIISWEAKQGEVQHKQRTWGLHRRDDRRERTQKPPNKDKRERACAPHRTEPHGQPAPTRTETAHKKALSSCWMTVPGTEKSIRFRVSAVTKWPFLYASHDPGTSPARQSFPLWWCLVWCDLSSHHTASGTPQTQHKSTQKPSKAQRHSTEGGKNPLLSQEEGRGGWDTRKHILPLVSNFGSQVSILDSASSKSRSYQSRRVSSTVR